MRFPTIFGARHGAIAGTLAVGLVLGFSSFTVVRAEHMHKNASCNSSNYCQIYDNTGSGGGVEGESRSTYGVTGTTTASNGNSGVAGFSTGSKGAGVYGNSINSDGIYGTSSSGNGSAGVNGVNTGVGNGIFGKSLNGDGAQGYIAAGGRITGIAGVAGIDKTGDYRNYGVYAYSKGGVALYARQESSVETIFEGVDTGTGASAVIDQNANITITGRIFTEGSCRNGCAKTNGGRRIVSYAPRESLPTMEDTGEARLVAGRAYVRIDSSFANVIDGNADYLVLITPEGDSRGLFVTEKSTAGFEVRENLAGRSTLSFAYRIVAKPYGEASRRLPAVDLAQHRPM